MTVITERARNYVAYHWVVSDETIWLNKSLLSKKLLKKKKYSFNELPQDMNAKAGLGLQSILSRDESLLLRAFFPTSLMLINSG